MFEEEFLCLQEPRLLNIGDDIVRLYENYHINTFHIHIL